MGDPVPGRSLRPSWADGGAPRRGILGVPPVPPVPGAGAEAAARAAEGPAPRWVEVFIVFQLLCQLALISGQIGGGRVVVRLASFTASLALLALIRGRGIRHPAAAPAVVVCAIAGLATLNPGTSTALAGLAHATLYVAVIAPLFWVSRLRIGMPVLRRTVTILWLFHTLSAGLGVVQVWYPGRFQPPVSSVVLAKGESYLESLKIVTAGGQKVYRPMGLTDMPGGAGISGLYAVLFGMGFFLTRRHPAVLGLALLGMGTGTACLYLSQVRALVVMTGVSVVAITVILMWRRDLRRLTSLGVALALVAVIGFTAARSLSGAGVQRRMASLVTQKPGDLYYANRGRFLEETFVHLVPRYPFGAGLGRWGMMASYFAQGSTAEPLWVEIQWTGWIVDGGVPLTLAYVAAILAALLAAWKVARTRAGPDAQDLPFWGAIVLAYGIGALALTFSYPLFLGQTGMEFWLLNATLVAAAASAARGPAAAG
jgi:hypothetical protein